jgi:hypothetical protein
VSREEVDAFLKQVELISMVGEEDADVIAGQIQSCADRNPGVYLYPVKESQIERIQAPEPKHLILDKAGYFVVYPEMRRKRLVVEHYTNQGVLNCVLEGTSTGALYSDDNRAPVGYAARPCRVFRARAGPRGTKHPDRRTFRAGCRSWRTCSCGYGFLRLREFVRMPLHSETDYELLFTRYGESGLPMKTRVYGLIAVVLIAVGIIAYKANRTQQTQRTTTHPRVLLVADFREAGSDGDACAEIIRSVRAAQARGIAVQELSPDSKSDLLARYHVLTIPTVLIFDDNEHVVSRFEGEGPKTVAAVRNQMRQLK